MNNLLICNFSSYITLKINFTFGLFLTKFVVPICVRVNYVDTITMVLKKKKKKYRPNSFTYCGRGIDLKKRTQYMCFKSNFPLFNGRVKKTRVIHKNQHRYLIKCNIKVFHRRMHIENKQFQLANIRRIEF